MTTYDVLVADELLPHFTNDNPLMPAGFRVVGTADGPAGPHQARIRVEDDNAPAWTEGRLITPTFTEHRPSPLGPTTVSVSAYHPEPEPAAHTRAEPIAEAIREATDNPGRIVTVDRQDGA